MNASKFFQLICDWVSISGCAFFEDFTISETKTKGINHKGGGFVELRFIERFLNIWNPFIETTLQ